MSDLEEVDHSQISDANPEDSPGGKSAVTWDSIPKDAELEIDYMGQRIKVKGEKLKDLVQMGYRFSDRKGELERTYNEKLVELDKAYDPYRKFDDALRQDPLGKKLIKAVMQRDVATLQSGIQEMGGKPLAHSRNGDEDSGNADYYEERMNAMERRLLGKFEQFGDQMNSRIGEMTGSVSTLTSRAQEAEEVAFLKTNPNYSRFASDDRIAMAQDHKRKFGGDLVSAFRNVTWEQMPGLVEEEIVNRFGIDRESLEMPGSRPPVVNGITLDEKTMARLFDNPDELAQHASAIQAHRRKSRGLGPVARSSRR